MHAMTHCSAVSGAEQETYEDAIWTKLQEEDCAIMPAKGSYTIAWHLWHITRIEDLVGNILIMDTAQVFNTLWAKRLNTSVTDTGNAMTDAEVATFSQQLTINALRDYRAAVGRQTREMLKALNPDDMRRKPAPESLARIMAEGGLTEQKGSKWLLNFWGKKTVAGLILLPLTRHHVMHLNSCMALKSTIQGKT